jgi:uncharacterized protein YndB with AHSA1/START domain
MDTVTGTQVAVARTVPIPRERMWDLVTAVDRIGEWSPEATGGSWCDGAQGPAPGARFIGRNRFPSGFESMVTCVVVEAERPGVFACSDRLRSARGASAGRAAPATGGWKHPPGHNFRR